MPWSLMPGPFTPLASRVKQTDDMLFLPDGSRMVKCSKHGWTNCAGRAGWDDRCGECVMDLLSRYRVTEVQPYPKLDLSKSLIFIQFDHKTLDQDGKK